VRNLAAEGRTVFLSSHLLSEMAETVDRVIVIGRGRRIADLSIREAIERGGAGQIRVASPHAPKLAGLLARAGATVEQGGADDADALLVSGLDAARIGALAAEHQVVLHELTPRRASLEEAFLGLTRGSVAYRAGPDESERRSTSAA
jgi:ABC-2 type transport system ATP-binding protein